jgi:hypothetical protein
MANGRTGVFTNPLSAWAFEADRMIEKKTRGYSIRAKGNQSLINRPNIWEQLRSLTDVIVKKKLANRRSPYMR